jgi:hypothetical protein
MHTLMAAFFITQMAAPSPEAPFHEPQLAAERGLTAVAFGSGSSLYVATSTDGGAHFAQPVKVAGAPVVPLNRHRGPRIVLSGGTIVVTAVVGQTEAAGPHAHGLPADGDLLAWRSSDRGVTWSKPVRVNDVAAAPREGLHTLAADGHGNLFAAWLDQRNAQRGKGTALYGAWSSDSGATWSKNVEVYESPEGTICQCCHPTAVFDGTGGLEVMWRNVVEGCRDLYLIRADASHHFARPEKLGTGTWKINACPMDGGAMVHAGGKTITAWRREGDIFLAEPDKPETRIGEGKDVTLAVSGDKVYAAWVKGTKLIVWTSGKQQTVSEEAAFPNLTALPDGGALLAWEEKGGILFERLR